jgi:CheY-like chemotaxis protein
MSVIKVLLVDDEKQFRETTAKILAKRGYQVTLAGTGEEALEILTKQKHDVVILDLRMPGMGGKEALARIKKLDPVIQVIMLTGHGEEESARHSLEHEAFDFLSKPCELDRLAARINDAYTTAHKGKVEEKKARDVMIPLADYTTVSPDASIRDGINKLKASFEGLVSTDKLMQTGHRSILVMDNQGTLVGILSIMDLISGLRPAYLSAPKPSMADNMQLSAMFWTGLFTNQAKALAKKSVREVMSPPPVAIDEEANLMEIANLVYEGEARRLVVKSGNKVVGVIREQEIFFELSTIILETR